LDYLERLGTFLKPVSEEQDANAAVALLLKNAGRDFEVLVVKRAESAFDEWSGQMALPGGKRNAKDQSLKQTVVRETFEETGINLLDLGRFLGTMEPQRSMSRPELKIIAFIVFLEEEPFVKLNVELEEFTWITFTELVNHKKKIEFSFGETQAYVIGKNVIWGLTYRILEEFISILERLRYVHSQY